MLDISDLARHLSLPAVMIRFLKLTRAFRFVITIFSVWLPYSVLFSQAFSAANLERIETTFAGPVKTAHFSNTYEL